ncbi:hypothetical protein IV102_37415 [bacterium]|nr:hypothetical protein [bacterium]
MRTPKTIGNTEVWYPVNRRAGVLLILSSLLYLGVAALCPQHGRADFSTWVASLRHLCCAGGGQSVGHGALR